MQRLSIVLLLTIALRGADAQTAAPGRPFAHNAPQDFTGIWWHTANPGERGGFINGVADCMTWEAHKRGYSATPETLAARLEHFYETHPEERMLSVADAWQRVASADRPSVANNKGEAWTNPHWYLNGDWWAQQAATERFGFVEGYLWCMRTQVPAARSRFSMPAAAYQAKIDAYIRANPAVGAEPVAETLRRVRDRTKS